MFVPHVFRHRAFIYLASSRFFSSTASVTQSVALGWLVYTVARQSYDERISMFLVGMLGLVQFLPMFAISLFAGEMVDRYDRRWVLMGAVSLQIFCAACFTIEALQSDISLFVIFVVAALFGVVRAFLSPATATLVPMLVPRHELSKAIGYNSLGFQIGIIIGPWIGGTLCGVSVALANDAAFGLYVLAGLMGVALLREKADTRPKAKSAPRGAMIREGLQYLWKSKIVLGAISLDLFAVLLGGVTALLPAYAKDILNTGPEGFGYLRLAFALGAVVMTLLLAVRPIQRHSGKWMLAGVGLYGVATVCFALSRNMTLSLVMLAIAGAGDSISVFTRQNLVQILTPDHMRGRVTSVSSLFIGASNELGEFESGVAARLLGVVGAAVFGGVGAVLVTGLWARLFPDLRKADRLIPHEPVISSNSAPGSPVG